MLNSISRVYANANQLRPHSYSEYKDINLTYQSTDGYSIIKKIGRGKYSEVFLGIEDATQSEIVIKVLKPVADQKIKREIKILTNLQCCENVVKLLNIVFDVKSNTPSLIFEYVETQSYKELYSTFSDYDIRFYMLELLEALDSCHSMGIMHRDVKPQNIVIDHKKRKLRLIDWGLADFYHADEKYNVRVASRYYKGPELLVNYQTYDYSLDIWASGCTFAGMIFKKDTIFQGKDNQHQLVLITKVLGSENLINYLTKYNIPLEPKFMKKLKNHPKIPWKKFVNEENRNLISYEALDLLERMMQFDHQHRITAREAANHPYFANNSKKNRIPAII